jgi:cell wall-associated NlpC family hydrolase
VRSRPMRRVLGSAAFAVVSAASLVGLASGTATAQTPATVASAQQIHDAATIALYALVNHAPVDAGAGVGPQPSADDPTPPEAPTPPDAYTQSLTALAAIVAPIVHVDPVALAGVWGSASQVRMIATLTAMGQVGDPYKRLGSGPDAFDCSGLVWFSWKQAGVKLARTSSEMIQNAKPITQTEIQPGDLVWRPGHIMIAIGVGDAVVDAPQAGRNVELKPWGIVRRFGAPV